MHDTARTVVIHEFGGPEVLRFEDRPLGEPGPGEVRIRHHACGLNLIDVYQRTGLYPLQLPHALGMEAAGVIEAVGEGVTHLEPGQRAAYAANPPGAYSEARVMPAAQSQTEVRAGSITQHSPSGAVPTLPGNSVSTGTGGPSNSGSDADGSGLSSTVSGLSLVAAGPAASRPRMRAFRRSRVNSGRIPSSCAAGTPAAHDGAGSAEAGCS